MLPYKVSSSLLLVRRSSGLRFAIDAELMGRRDIRRLRIQQTLVVGTKSQFDQRSRIRSDLGLPAIG